MTTLSLKEKLAKLDNMSNKVYAPVQPGTYTAKVLDFNDSRVSDPKSQNEYYEFKLKFTNEEDEGRIEMPKMYNGGRNSAMSALAEQLGISGVKPSKILTALIEDEKEIKVYVSKNEGYTNINFAPRYKEEQSTDELIAEANNLLNA